MKQFSFYTSQPAKDKSLFVSDALQEEGLEVSRVMSTSGYAVIMRQYKKQNGYESVEILGVK